MSSLPPPNDGPAGGPRLTGLQAFTRVVGAILNDAAGQLSPRELEVFHETLIEMLARHVGERRKSEAA